MKKIISISVAALSLCAATNVMAERPDDHVVGLNVLHTPANQGVERQEFQMPSYRIAGFDREEALLCAKMAADAYTPGSNEARLVEAGDDFQVLDYQQFLDLKNQGFTVERFGYEQGKEYIYSGFVAKRGNDVYVSFHGTESVENVRADLNIAKRYDATLGGYVARGFDDELTKANPSLMLAMERLGCFENLNNQVLNSDFNFRVVGHSLGGAIATLFAAKLDKFKRAREDAVHLCTFGAPRSFDHAIFDNSKSLNKRTLRIYQNKTGLGIQDVVAAVSPGSMGFKHLGQALVVKTDGTPHLMSGYIAALESYASFHPGYVKTDGHSLRPYGKVLAQVAEHVSQEAQKSYQMVQEGNYQQAALNFVSASAQAVVFGLGNPILETLGHVSYETVKAAKSGGVFAAVNVAVTGGLKGAGQVALNMATPVADIGVEALSAIGLPNAAFDAVSYAGSAMVKVAGGVYNAASTLGSGVYSAVLQVQDGQKFDAAKTVAKATAGAAYHLGSAAVGATKNVVEGTVEVSKSIVSATTGTISSLASKASGFGGWALKKIWG